MLNNFRSIVEDLVTSGAIASTRDSSSKQQDTDDIRNNIGKLIIQKLAELDHGNKRQSLKISCKDTFDQIISRNCSMAKRIQDMGKEMAAMRQRCDKNNSDAFKLLQSSQTLDKLQDEIQKTRLHVDDLSMQLVKVHEEIRRRAEAMEKAKLREWESNEREKLNVYNQEQIRILAMTSLDSSPLIARKNEASEANDHGDKLLAEVDLKWQDREAKELDDFLTDD